MGVQLETKEQLSAASLELLRDIEKLFADPQVWLEMENTRLMGRRPIDLIGTSDEGRVRHVIDSLIYGWFS